MAHAFDLFNHANPGRSSGCVDCGTSLGLITDIVAPQGGTTVRRLRFADRFQFQFVLLRGSRFQPPPASLFPPV
jgi:hypothetical protein